MKIRHLASNSQSAWILEQCSIPFIHIPPRARVEGQVSVMAEGPGVGVERSCCLPGRGPQLSPHMAAHVPHQHAGPSEGGVEVVMEGVLVDREGGVADQGDVLHPSELSGQQSIEKVSL